MADDILYYRDDDIELWTVNSSGEGAVSQRGLSRMSGVAESTLRGWFESLRGGLPLEHLKPLLGKELELRENIKLKGRQKIKPIRSEVAAFVILYAAVELKKTEAILSLAAFAHIGLDSYIQGKTGWLPIEKQSSKQSRSLIDCLLNNPKIWSMHFKPAWRIEACRVTGYHWHPSRPMAQFISTYIYKALPKDVYERLMIVNADRRHRHHQFFDDLADEVVLKEHIQQVGGLLRVSRNKTHFKQLFTDAFSDGIQAEIEFDDSEEDQIA